VFPNLNCLMGCEGVSAGRAQAPGDVGEIVQSACLSRLLAASTEMLSKTGACRRADGARELSLGTCQHPALLSQRLPGSDLPEPSPGHRLQWNGARPALARVHPAAGGGCPWTRRLCSSRLASAGDVQGHAGLCTGVSRIGGVLHSGAAAGSSTEPCCPQGQPCPACLWCNVP